MIEAGPTPTVDQVVRWKQVDLRRVIVERQGVQLHEFTLDKLLHPHMVSDGRGRPLTFFLFPRQRSDAKGALVLLAEMLCAKRLLGDRGYDADWPRDELKAWGVRVCIPARSKRRRPATHNRTLYKKRCRIENAFARLKDWRGIAMRYTRCGDLLLPASALAAAVTFRMR